MADNFKYVQTQAFQIAGAGQVIGDTSMTLDSFKTIDGVNLAMTDFGSIGYGTVQPNAGTSEEQVSFTGVTQNGNGTATLTGIKSVLFLSPYTETSGFAKDHAGGVTFVISNTSGFYNQILSKNDDETILGKYTFPAGSSANRPVLAADDADATDNTQLITHGELVRTAIAGAVAASTTQVGYVKLSVASGTPTAPVVVGTNDNRVPPIDTSSMTAGRVAALAGDNTDVAVGAGNLYVTQTGLQHNAEKFAVDGSGSSTAYTATLSPAPTSYTNGMVVYVKITLANTTTTPSLSVNGITAKTIVKLNGTALAVGDISAGMYCTFIYDLTHWVLQNPVTPVTQYQIFEFTSSGTWFCPRGVTGVLVDIVGGGGGGGGGASGSTGGGGGGGGGQGLLNSASVVSPFTSYSVVVGNGGAGGGVGVGGSSGGTSSFNGLTCTGGNGGSNGSGSTGGGGGTGGNATAGNGGAGATGNTNGFNGTAGTAGGVGGTGGTAAGSGGGGGGGASGIGSTAGNGGTGGAGSPGQVGAGGGGASGNSVSTTGAGGAGIVIIKVPLNQIV